MFYRFVDVFVVTRASLFRVVEREVSRVDGDHSLPFVKLQFATTLPPIVPLTDDDYLHQELYEAEEQFGK